MLKIKIRRLLQVFQYGWQDARDIQAMSLGSRMTIFSDILHCFMKYYVSGFQYKKNHLWELSGSKKEHLAKQIGEENRFKDEWLCKYYENWQFINDYSGVSWETSQKRRTKRNKAYSRFYGFGNNCWTQCGVSILFEHYSIGSFKVGDNCFFARGCDLDITGDLELGNNVDILEGAKILTHAHDPYHLVDNSEIIPFSNRAYKTNLRIGDNVTICAHAMILPGVKVIGENSVIQAGAIVNKPVPANTIVGGNPAQVVLKMPKTVKRDKHD